MAERMAASPQSAQVFVGLADALKVRCSKKVEPLIG